MRVGKRAISLGLTTAMVLGLTVPVMASDMDGKLVILHTNDIHGNFGTTEEGIGAAGAKSLKEYYEAQGAEVLLVDAGDYSQGNTLVNYTQGISAAEFLVAADYDVVTLGNHEFDFSFDKLKEGVSIMEEGGIQVVCANIMDKETGVSYFTENTIFELDGMTVGFFGLDTAETLTKASPTNVADVSFVDGEEMYAIAQEQADFLAEAGCDYIVAMTHLGVDAESVGRRSIDVAEAITGVDLIIDGHSHTEMDGGEMVGEALIVSAGSYMANIGVVEIDKATGETDAHLLSAATYAETIGLYDAEVTAFVAEKQAEVDAVYDGIFAETLVDLNGEREPGVRTEETNLGDFAADAYLYVAKQYAEEKELDLSVDVALANGGGIRASIPTGEISMNTLYTVFPYGNTIALVTLTGEQLLEVMEASTFCNPESLGGFPQVAGMEFTLDTTVEYAYGEQYPDSTYFAPADPGSRVTIDSIGGEAFDLNGEYTVVVNAFQASGGDTYFVLTEGEMIDTEIIDAEGLIMYVASMDGIIGEEYAEPQGRITIISDESAVVVEEEVVEEEVIEEVVEAEVVEEVVVEEVIVLDGSYVVVAGDNLWKIASKVLGDGNKWSAIYEANKDVIADPNMIYVGQQLIV
ncbi:5'-nucleotidase C-terminal domain-containing protein [Chakrabartyella piscis]|uniref:5'-nucleotidase C-terminal domain-containing protein n=1 Tax=Chakrabartyella piscis TaxID=2918914 RepID=UPI002958DF08|nr:5'-nucleotidase C-terminal domain-containing protein [Chakrabartyella piscis]